MLNIEGLDELSQMNIVQQLIYYVQQNGPYLWDQFVRHFLISIYGVLFAALVAIPLGFYIARHSKLADWVVGAANVIQTIPSLAMLSILMLGFGIGVNTVIITVFLYSLLPIVKNTYAGVKNVDNALMDAAKGMGMTRWQQTYKVELPMALSVIMAGLRNALVVAIGVTAIGTFIGAGGLGDIIQRGVNASQGGAIILAGAIPTALMAVAADLVLAWLERKLNPASRVSR
ncbi:ABC transporter permease [Alkalibacterium pelagium]|jgi:osmoprotectant transport system permease protein|uniref:Osmoprotectant transport system permease protein n=1 Tax=Alkalibacterium pelagium TaxID=426702 RepID=A0A1H7GQ12_9LACT|nr:ABC transporter permease [Alkalibacterium pelagium]GEN49789.1 amino acid ABC transporter permease [Alkalibacterium pelagium]SEK37955.1 osmoprotectant transport system permease protein [Alkalibacterium pelagium]